MFAQLRKSDTIYAAPVKNGLYDFLQLAHQVTVAAASHKKSKSKDDKPSEDEFLSGFWKSDRLLPVLTVAFYRKKRRMQVQRYENDEPEVL